MAKAISSLLQLLRRPVRLALMMLVLLLACPLSAPVSSSAAYADPSDSIVRAPAAGRPLIEEADVDREVILDLVRRHRRTTSERWCRTVADAVYQESVAAGVDPLIVAAIVAKESSFHTRVVSRAGAVGLMQIRPFVARDVAERTDLEWRGIETLHRPELNVRLGVKYYQELVQRFDGDHHTALAAYNRGPSRVRRQIRKGTFGASRYADGILCLYEELDDLRAAVTADSEEASA